MTEQTAELCRQIAARIRTATPPPLPLPHQAGRRNQRGGDVEFRPVSAEEYRAAWARIADTINMIGGGDGDDDSLRRVARGVLAATDRLVYTDETVRHLHTLAKGQMSDPDHPRWGRDACEATAFILVRDLLDMVPLGGGWHTASGWGTVSGLRPAICHLRDALSSHNYPDDADRYAHAGLEALAGRPAEVA